jgi:hypothetical protein
MILEQFYYDIMKAVMAVPSVKYFDKYNGQYLNEGEELNYNTPAVFMEFAPIEWQTLGQKRQSANIEFLLHLQTDQIAETNSLEKEQDRALALEHLRIEEAIAKKLQGMNGSYFGTLSRINITDDSDHDSQVITLIGFKTRLVDDGLANETTSATPKLEITTLEL